MSVYDFIIEELTKKYKLTTKEPEGSIIYGLTIVYSKSNIRSWVSCYRYREPISKEILYAAELRYGDINIMEESTNEL